MEIIKINGLIEDGSLYHSRDDDSLRINHEPLSEQLEDIKGKFVTARFFISETEKDKSELISDLILSTSGCLDVRYLVHYSEYTGYLWTTDELIIGNHDIIEILCGYHGKWLTLELEVSDEAPPTKQTDKTK